MPGKQFKEHVVDMAMLVLNIMFLQLIWPKSTQSVLRNLHKIRLMTQKNILGNADRQKLGKQSIFFVAEDSEVHTE